MGFFPHDRYVEMTMHFRCNLRCEHCMIEGTMDHLQPEGMDRLHEVFDYNRAKRSWDGLILTGSEITLRRDLPDIARQARANGFEHVRIQTHGMRLANADYCAELVDAGIDEYFVSVTAADAERHDAITEVRGSFDKTLQGLANLDAHPEVVVLTNTVVTRRSFDQLEAVVERLAEFERLVQMEFWNYWPMQEADSKDLIVSHLEALPHLRGAILRARELGRSVEVKNFPECLLGSLGDALDNSQSKLIIDPSFWTEFMRNGFDQCVHRDYCGAQRCLGLNTAYVKKFGWHADELVPLSLDTAEVG